MHNKFQCCLFPWRKCKLSFRTALGIITDIPHSVNPKLKCIIIWLSNQGLWNGEDVDETGNLNKITIGNPDVTLLRRPGYRQKENVWKTDRILINVTLSRVGVNIVAAEKQKYYIIWVCVCSTTYPLRNVHDIYCHLWPVWLNHIFPHYLINGTVLGGNLMKIKCVFLCSVQLLSETFLILLRTKRDVS